MDPSVVSAFHDEYYNAMPTTWENTFFLGVPVRKNPMDLWTYQEIIFANRPDIIIECGTAYGGSALWFAHCLDMIGRGMVITLDIMDRQHFPDRPNHDRIVYLRGDTAKPTAVAKAEAVIEVNTWAAREPSVMVVLDAEHTQDHVRAELELWPHLVTIGQYLVVEDTDITPALAPQYALGGPAEALADWHRFWPEFELDPECQRHGLTFNPGGWLKKVSEHVMEPDRGPGGN